MVGSLGLPVIISDGTEKDVEKYVREIKKS